MLFPGERRMQVRETAPDFSENFLLLSVLYSGHLEVAKDIGCFLRQAHQDISAHIFGGVSFILQQLETSLL